MYQHLPNSVMGLRDAKQAVFWEHSILIPPNARSICILNPPLGIPKCKLTRESF